MILMSPYPIGGKKLLLVYCLTSFTPIDNFFIMGRTTRVLTGRLLSRSCWTSTKSISFFLFPRLICLHDHLARTTSRVYSNLGDKTSPDSTWTLHYETKDVYTGVYVCVGGEGDVHLYIHSKQNIHIHNRIPMQTHNMYKRITIRTTHTHTHTDR